jgi:hypothetical protein
MGAGADAGECSGNGALAARNRDASRVAGNLARVIFTSAISDQGCILCCRDSRTYLLAMRIRFSGCVHIPLSRSSRRNRPQAPTGPIMTNSSFVSCRTCRRPPCPSRTGNTSRAWRFGEPPELKHRGRVKAHVNDNPNWGPTDAIRERLAPWLRSKNRITSA